MHYNIHLTLDEINNIITALAQFKYSEVADTIAKIRDQVTPQIPTVNTAAAVESVATVELPVTDFVTEEVPE